MIDHVLLYASEKDMLTAKVMTPHLQDGALNGSYCFGDIQMKDQDGSILMPGYMVMVSLPRADKQLVSQPECVLVMDRDADAYSKEPFIYADTKLGQMLLDGLVRLDGKPAGSDYTDFKAEKLKQETALSVAVDAVAVEETAE